MQHPGAIPRRRERAAKRRGLTLRRGDAAARRRRRGAPRRRPPRPTRLVAGGRGPWLAETLQGAAPARGPRARRPGRRASGRRCGPTSRRACAGCACCRGSASGACLADDMGLGKTIQVLALLLRAEAARGAPAAEPRSSCRPRCSPTGRPRSRASRRPAVAGRASLGDAGGRAEGARPSSGSPDVDLVITTYGTLAAAAVARERCSGTSWCSTRRRRSRTRPRGRRAPSSSCRRGRASR